MKKEKNKNIKINENNEIIDEDKLELISHINKKNDKKQKTHSKVLKVIILIICICLLPINPKKDRNNFNNIFNDIIFNNKTNNITKNISNDNNNKIIVDNVDNKHNILNTTNLTYKYDENSIKPLAIYLLKTYPISKKNEILNNQSYIDKLKTQIEYAKNNSIYGFGIYYDLNINAEIFNEPLDIIINNKNLDIPFLIILHNENKEINNNLFIWHITNLLKYFHDDRYIRFNKKPIIGIYNPEGISNLKKKLVNLRNKLKEIGIGEIFILGACKENNIDKFIKMNIFDGFYDSTSYYSIKPNKKGNSEEHHIYFYLLYKNQDLNSFYSNRNKIIFRSSDIMSKYPIYINKKNIYFDYSPDKFDFLNKIIIDWTKKKYEKNRYIFINSFDNNYLDPENKIGRESLNKLSQLINSDSIEKPNYDFSNLRNICSIAVQAHVYYADLIDQIVNLTNNIPVKFDLYITTTKKENINIIEEYVKSNSKANKYEILLVENKGRDVLPLLTQLKNVFENYKYICHIHTKKSRNNWRNYLFYNLLGKNIISDILYDFETNDKLGLIFPPFYYEILYVTIQSNKKDIHYLKEIFKGISDKIKVTDKFDFPAGNMFWAKSKAVHQIIKLDITKSCPEEPLPSGGTILHAIERTWKFIAEYNGYTYKQFFKYL